ncbi:TPA: hypothetical protein ACGQN8_000573 [Streptococcus agalactiae]
MIPFPNHLYYPNIIPKSNPKLTKKDFLTKKVIPLNYVALGDSLTEGVGAKPPSYLIIGYQNSKVLVGWR